MLQSTDILLYTPANEHFGIVPVEAMWLGCVVIACNSGGPLESIVDGQTGFLREPKADIWAEMMIKLAKNKKDLRNSLLIGKECDSFDRSEMV